MSNAIKLRNTAYKTLGKGLNIENFGMGSSIQGSPWSGRTYSNATILFWKALGFGHVRAPLEPKYVVDQTTSGAPTGVYLNAWNNTKTLVAEMRAAGLKVILDMHHYNANDYGDITRTNIANNTNGIADKLQTWWSMVASYYANDTGVLLEVFNEPAFSTDALWQAYANRTVNTIRAAAPDTTVVVGANYDPLSMDTPQSYLQALVAAGGITDKNVIYSIHDYQEFPFSHQAVSTSRTSVGSHDAPYPPREPFSTTHLNTLKSEVGFYSFASTDVDTTNNLITVTAPLLTTGTAVQIVSSGTVPGGVNSVSSYFNYVRNNGTTISLHSSAADATNDANRVDITSQGSGTISVTTPMIATYYNPNYNRTYNHANYYGWGEKYWGGSHQRMLKTLFDYARTQDMLLFFNEFGFGRYVDPADMTDAYRFLAERRCLYESKGAPWSIWDWDNNFRITTTKGDSSAVPTAMRAALGLTPG